jgi:putative holliday junction resolvase
MKLIGIDYGDKKIGIAITEGFLAEPYLVIPTKKATIEIKSIVRKENVNKIVVGISEGVSAQKTENFIKELKKYINISIIKWDETNSTNSAIRKLIDAGTRISKRKKEEDAVAAALILQSYIDEMETKANAT